MKYRVQCSDCPARQNISSWKSFHDMGLHFIPLYAPAFIFGFIYIVISIYLDKNQSANINHLAHIIGCIYGIVFMFLAFMIFAHINVFALFIDNIQITFIKD